MPTRFDHAVIIVRDLERATSQFQRLGFDTQPGGKHTGRGTHNALIRFGLEYVELLSVYDEAEARAFNSRRFTLLDLLHGREARLATFALATEQIEQEAERFKGSGNEIPQPQPMSRRRPDGQQLTWRTLAPGASSYNQPWPFLIQWDMPDEQRLRIDRPGEHPNGATSWTRLSVITSNFDQTLNIYRNQLELDLLKLDVDTHQSARRALLCVGISIITLLAPLGEEGPAQQLLAEEGEGPFVLSFHVRDLDQTRHYLERQGIAFKQASGSTPRITLDPAETYGIRIHLAQ